MRDWTNYFGMVRVAWLLFPDSVNVWFRVLVCVTYNSIYKSCKNLVDTYSFLCNQVGVLLCTAIWVFADRKSLILLCCSTVCHTFFYCAISFI